MWHGEIIMVFKEEKLVDYVMIHLLSSAPTPLHILFPGFVCEKEKKQKSVILLYTLVINGIKRK